MAWDAEYPRPPIRRRRNIRGPLTMLFLLALLSSAAYYGWNTTLGAPKAEVRQVCRTPGADGRQNITATEVTVNVYNAGDVVGLAEDTANELRERGFTVDEIGNEPSDETIDNVVVRGRAVEAPEVQLLLAQVTGERPIADGRAETTVDLVLGDDFKGLVPDAPTRMTVRTKIPVCRTATVMPSS